MSSPRWPCCSSRPPPPAQAGPRRAGSRPRFLHRRPEARRRPVRGGSSFRSGRRVAAVAQELSRAHGGAVTSVYQYALKGFAARLTADAGRGPGQRSPRRLRRAGPGVHALATQSPPPGGSTGSTSATCRSTTPTPTTRPGRACTPTSSTPASAPPTRSSAAGSGTASRRQRRERHERLQRPRHARGGHGGRHHLRRGQAGHAPRGARARAARARARTRASSPASTG